MISDSMLEEHDLWGFICLGMVELAIVDKYSNTGV